MVYGAARRLLICTMHAVGRKFQPANTRFCAVAFRPNRLMYCEHSNLQPLHFDKGGAHLSNQMCIILSDAFNTGEFRSIHSRMFVAFAPLGHYKRWWAAWSGVCWVYLSFIPKSHATLFVRQCGRSVSIDMAFGAFLWTHPQQ